MYRYNSKDDFGLPTYFYDLYILAYTALFVTGHKEEARCLFDEVLKYSNHLGLFNVSIDFETKERLDAASAGIFILALVNTAILFAKKRRGYLLSGLEKA